MKKINFLAACMLAYIGLSASAAPTAVTQGDFSFEVLNDTAVCMTAYTGVGPELKVPASVTVNGKTYKVTKIGGKCCKDNTSIEALEVPEPVSTIGYEAFANCSRLRTIVLPATTTYLGQFCFSVDPVESVTVYAINPPDSPGSVEIDMTNTTYWWSYENIFKGSASHWEKSESLKSQGSANAGEYKPSFDNRYIDATLYVPPMSLDQYKSCSFDPGSKRKGVWGYFRNIESIPNYWSGLDDVLSGADETDSPSAIYDVTGRLVKADATESDLNGLPQGIYIFKGRKVTIK